MKVTKQEAAKRQLITAIKLFFSRGDLLSIFALTSAVFMITENLAASSPEGIRSKNTFFETVGEILSSEEMKNLKLDMGKKPGFLKHANRFEEEDINDVSNEEVVSFLVVAIENYEAVFHQTDRLMALLKAYFLALIPDDRLKVFSLTTEQLAIIRNHKRILEAYGHDYLKREFDELAQ